MAQLAESAPVIEDDGFDKTKFGSEMYGKGALAERKRIAAMLGKPEIVDQAKFEAHFKSLNDAEEKRLQEAGQYKELAEKREREAAEAKASTAKLQSDLAEERFRNAFLKESTGKVADFDLALSMTKPEDRAFDDSGNVVDVQAIVERILTDKPILRATAGKGDLGTPTSGSGTQVEGGKNAAKIQELRNELEGIEKKPFRSGNDLARKHEIRTNIQALQKG